MKIALLSLSILFSLAAQAIPSDLLIDVLQSTQVQRYTTGASISSIVETAVYRCPSCYDLEMNLLTPVGPQVLKISTRSGIVRGVNISVSAVTK